MPEKIFLNDKIVDSDRACISPADGGLLYGAGLFETMRSRNGVVFRMDDHLDRLMTSAAALSIEPSYDKNQLGEAVYQVLRANELTDARIRLTLTSGPVTQTEEQHQSTLLITAVSFQPYPAQYYKAGVLAVLCPYRQNPSDPTCGLKTTCYYPRVLALRYAHRNGAAEALWFTTDNRLAEGCVSNVFIVKNSSLLTPPLSTPVLPGIARRTVLEIAGRLSIQCTEKDLNIEDVLGADEIFLTNVVMTVCPVVSVEKHTVADGKVGPVATRLREEFMGTMEEYCRRQA
jgi:branched-chain amino acid aminotransferase